MNPTTKLLTGQLAELTEIEVHEVSLVPAGANGRPLLARKSVEKADPSWVAAGDRDLDVNTELTWSSSQAAARVFAWAGWPDNPDPTKARRAFCLYDSANAELKGSYKLGFADIVDDELVAIEAGLSAARGRINQVEDVPDDVIADAQALLDAYAESEDGSEEMGKGDLDSKISKAIDALQTLRSAAKAAPGDVAGALLDVASFLAPTTKVATAQDPELVQLLKDSTATIAQLRLENERLRSKTFAPASTPTQIPNTPAPKAQFPSEFRQGKARG